MNKYTVPIPNEKAGTYKLVTFMILLLNFFVFGFVFMRTQTGSANALAITGLAVNGIPLIYYLLNKKHLKTPFTEIVFFINAVIWLLWGSWLLAVLMVLFSFFSFLANKKFEIFFNETGIVYPSFPVKKYAWAEVEQAIWKDGILTIDLKSNKLMQFNIDDAFAAGFDAAGFNQYCAAKTGAA